jgi:tetratricopeptide (TPR) repeat protein
MSHAKTAVLDWTLLILLSATTSVLGQSNPHDQLHQALLFEKQQRFDAAIASAKSALDSNQLNQIERGRAYIELGFALQMKGRLVEAQSAFENAIRLLETDPANATDYAAALDNYAGLYDETGQFDRAIPIWLKALHLRQKIGDHEAIAHSFVNLAGLALSENQVHKAKQYLRQASHEMKLARDLTDDDLALFYETQGWLAMDEGNPSLAVDDYRRALDLCVRAHGQEHWLAGWERILLGRAYLKSGHKGDINRGLADMSDGLAIIGHALGQENPKYLVAELAYSHALDQAGSHAEAARLKAAAEQAGRELSRSQCVGCTIDVSAFR